MLSVTGLLREALEKSRMPPFTSNWISSLEQYCLVTSRIVVLNHFSDSLLWVSDLVQSLRRAEDQEPLIDTFEGSKNIQLRPGVNSK